MTGRYSGKPCFICRDAYEEALMQYARGVTDTQPARPVHLTVAEARVCEQYVYDFFSDPTRNVFDLEAFNKFVDPDEQ